MTASKQSLHRWSPASLTLNNYFPLFLYLYITRITINDNAPNLKSSMEGLCLDSYCYFQLINFLYRGNVNDTILLQSRYLLSTNSNVSFDTLLYLAEVFKIYLKVYTGQNRSGFKVF